VKIHVHHTPLESGDRASQALLENLAASPSRVVGVATGSSPLPLYRALAERVENGLDLRTLTVVALDEYVGLASGHPQSYRAFIERDVAAPLRLDPALVYVPDGTADDPEQACRQFEEQLQAIGDVSVQILGIGENGHIAFNEPGTVVHSRTRVVKLSESTRTANARFFGPRAEVPTHAITQGMASILAAKHIILLAHGPAKAAATAAAVSGDVSPACPASFLQLHPSVDVFLDADSAAMLTDATRT